MNVFVTVHAQSFPDRLVPILKGYGLGRRKVQLIITKLVRIARTRGIAGTLAYLDGVSQRFTEWYSKGDAPSGGTWVNFRWWKRIVRKRPQLVKMCNKIKRVVLLTKLQPEQWNKFHSAANRSPAPQWALDELNRYVRVGAQTFEKVSNSPPDPCWNSYMESALRDVGGDLDAAELKAKSRFLRDMLWARDSGLLENPDVYGVYAPYDLHCVVSFANRLKVSKPNARDEYAGSLNVSQEPGAKARFFASPRCLIQAALSGLHRDLDHLMYDAPEDACHDQSMPVTEIQEKLRASELVWSVDLSNATDSFPLEPQLVFLRQVSVAEDRIRLFSHMARERFQTSDEIRKHTGIDSYAWTVGQPLGLKPSFAVFSLTMHSLIRGIAMCLRRPFRRRYFQLGDDHVSFDSVIAEEFIRVLQNAGVKISREKSIISRRVAEFAGYMVRHDGWSFRPGKWKSVVSSTAITYASDLNFNPGAVWPPKVANLVLKLRSRPWPFGFLITPPSEMDTNEYLKALRVITRPVLRTYDFTRFDLRNRLTALTLTKHLDREVQNSFNTHRYEANRIRYGVAEMALQESTRAFWKKLEIPCGQQIHISSYRTDWLDFDDTKSILYADLVASTWSGEIQASIANPLVKEIALRRRAFHPQKLTGALLESSPFRFQEAYTSSTRAGFWALLKRVADFKDVIPTRFYPMPIIKR